METQDYKPCPEIFALQQKIVLLYLAFALRFATIGQG